MLGISNLIEYGFWYMFVVEVCEWDVKMYMSLASLDAL